jgi:lysophospholipase L1-like esterase
MKTLSLIQLKSLTAMMLAACVCGSISCAQSIAWVGPTVITGDANLLTNGVYFDAFIPLLPGSLTADGVTFHAPTGTDTDGKISYVIASGSDQRYANNAAFTGGSSQFNAIMNAGGTFENGGAGAGTVTISGLTPGNTYSVQIFDYAGDGDAGLTTFSGSTPVTLTTTGSGATGGSFATGTFTATGATESFNWNGAGSSYTVLGAISVRKLPITPTVSPTNMVTAGSVVTLAVFAQPGQTYYQWQTDNGNGGVSWSNLAGANNTNYVLNTSSLAAGNYEFQVIVTNNTLNVTSAPVTVTIFAPPAQSIVWGVATVITGDANLLTNGVYFDAFIPLLPSPLTADGVTFHAPTGTDTDGKISYVVTSGSDQRYANNAAFTGGSSQFNAIMNAGGTFENGGAGAGTVTISSLTPGHTYSVQIFDYAGDGDAGLTTFSGSTPVTLTTTGSGATGGSFATGTFTATGATESFNWNGAGSSYTVLGAISVRDVSATATITPTNVTYNGDTVTLAVNAQPGPTYYQWQTDNGSGGTSWSNLAGANNTNYVLNTSSLTVGNHEFQVIVTNSTLNITSAPVVLTVLASSAPVILQNITPASASPFVGQSATFTAAFTGNHPITNQWQFSQDGGNTFSNLIGATNTILILTNLQPGNAGEYRLAAGNAFGSNYTAAAMLSVMPWSAAQIQWSAPVSLEGLNAGRVLTNVPGSCLEAAIFFYDSFIPVTAGNQQYVFRSDGTSASISNGAYYGGQFVTNAIYGSGALGTNSTGDARFDAVLNQYYDGGVSNVITLHNLIAGQQYTVQLFALDNRSGTTSELVDFADADDLSDVSAQFAMGDNAYLTGTFTATNTYQTIEENFLTGGFGNINALVVRALSYTPSVKPAVVVQPRQQNLLPTRAATFAVVADGAPTPNYQWQAGPVGGPYTNLADGGRYAGTATTSLTVFNVSTNDALEFVVAVTNAAGGVISAPVDLIAPVVAQPVATARPIRITCVGASDVSSPTPYGTPNWPDYITPMLGYEYTVINCGASGTTMIKVGNSPYWNTQQYTDGLNSSPDIVIIMLGSNDSKPYNWIYQTNYMHDYETMINQYRNLPSHPRIYLNTLLTVYGPGSYDITDPIVTGQLCPIIKQIAFDVGLPVIDVNAATKNMPQNFPDNVHPDIAGAKVVAQTVFNGLINGGETPPMVDQASNQPVAASSVANGNGATNAVDGDYTTMWQSAPSDNQWIYVDLGSVLNVTGVYLNWGTDYGQAYKIQISNDATNWTDVYTNNAGSGGINRISIAASGRFVRMLGQHSGTGNGYDLLDFTVTVSAPPPPLNINRASQGSFSLSWPSSSTSFTLEATTSLLPPVNWMQITNIIASLGGSNVTTITPVGNNMFFRLKQ